MDISIGFNAEPEGVLNQKDVERIFHNPAKVVGAEEGFYSIVKDSADYSRKVLSLTCPGNIIQENKTRVRLEFSKVESATLTYKVMFSKDVDFVRGGKLPGLAGGTAPRGGKKSDGSDGFSARVMWREGGEVFQYMYWMDRDPEKKWGDDLPWMDLEGDMMPFRFVPGQWHALTTRLAMNTPGKQDGNVTSWFDGRLALSTVGTFRAEGADFGIDQLIFTAFFGGNDSTWAPKKDEPIYFKDIRIAFD